MNFNTKEKNLVLQALRDFSWAAYGNERNEELENLILKVKESN